MSSIARYPSRRASITAAAPLGSAEATAARRSGGWVDGAWGDGGMGGWCMGEWLMIDGQWVVGDECWHHIYTFVVLPFVTIHT